jgi:hypothetical protein
MKATKGDKNPTAVTVTVGDKATSVKGIFQAQAKAVAALTAAARPDLTVRLIIIAARATPHETNQNPTRREKPRRRSIPDPSRLLFCLLRPQVSALAKLSAVQKSCRAAKAAAK